MWTPSPQILDEPVKILGLEVEDMAIVAVGPLMLSFFCGAFVSLVGGLAFGVLLYFAKRGRPPGALLHTLHGLELSRLPGCLGPRPQRYSCW